ncbi:hypothetical protein IWX84_001859 [Flavobacterium sp. CG_9.10]|uniref:hypothetical protein n=1 Tax=Flavobacterium sp. CG_9.10 TaxID=2787729 RepID=UPI0018C9F6EC|nr:hypothetical protein [Flavobacterium sp. CG_9.10]MBG6110977.1 hypothetical protein [Flavobacterium sp. CG_9.10]
MKKITILTLLLFSLSVFSQNEIKTVNRPDGVTLKYFNPSPIVIASLHEGGLSLYKNMNTKQYFLAVTVLFKKKSATEL